jgi:hypothetical protein
VQQPAKNLRAWLRLQRQGDWFRAYTSPDGRHWRLIDKVYLKVDSELLAGCALTGRETTPYNRTQQTTPVGCLFDQVQTGRGLRHHAFVPQIHLVSGSVVVEDIAFARDSRLHFAGSVRWPAIPFNKISLIQFQWVPSYWAPSIEAGRPGALLTSGEFLDGDLKEIHSGMCLMSTILFGLRQFDAHHELLSVVFRPPRPTTAVTSGTCEIQTWRGSVLRGTLRSLSEEGLLLQEPALGLLTVPFHSVEEITWPHAVSETPGTIHPPPAPSISNQTTPPWPAGSNSDHRQ